ncbi:MAG TPA: hypothetical protein VG942_03755 [Hyphomonadaceae bacterium]|nr:hypothetical protein [Hyphomonadaceae bacterium]
MKSIAVFLSGFAAMLAGAFIRSCDGAENLLLRAWCGKAPLDLSAMSHQHCAGCALAVAGMTLIAVSPLLSLSPPPSAGAKAR